MCLTFSLIARVLPGADRRGRSRQSGSRLHSCHTEEETGYQALQVLQLLLLFIISIYYYLLSIIYYYVSQVMKMMG